MDILVTILAWVLIGAIAGWLASIVTGTDAYISGWENVAAGIVGALLGGVVLGAFGFANDAGEFNLASLITAFVGAVLVLLVYKAVKTRR